jgi:YHS domain-containing protein
MSPNTCSRLSHAAALGILLLATAPCAIAEDPSPIDGIWKSKIPASTISGEFNNEDPVALAAGAHLKTDCSINLRAEDGKLYCFSTRTSLEFFQASPNTYLSAARNFFGRDQVPAQKQLQ